MARYTGSSNDPNLDALSQFGMSFIPTNIPGLGSNPGANITTVQRSPRMTTRTTVNNLPVGGNQATSRSTTPSPSKNVQYVGSSEINIADNVTLSGENIIAGAGVVDMRKGVKGPKSEQDDFVDGRNFPSQNVTINVGNNVTFNAKKNIIFGASYVRIDDEIEKITDEEIKKRYHELMDKLDGTLNVGSDESNEDAALKIKDAIRRTPGSIVKICSSICLILWNGGESIGTGFLARIPDFKDVVLLTAGHNFQPKKRYDGHFLYFKATDGDENGKGVVKIPFINLLSRKFSFVSTCKVKEDQRRTIGSRTVGSSDCKNIHHSLEKGDDVKEDLDYCMISLPGFEKFMDENKLDYLEAKEDVAKADRVFYVGHPYLGFSPGNYVRDNADPAIKEHYAKLELVDEDASVYEWKNKKGESWKLYPTLEQDMLRVDEKCPYYNGGYKEAKFSSTKKYTVIYGPDNEPFYLTANVEKETKMAKALRFSYGAKKKTPREEEDTKIKYTLDTKGGASGSPVLGDDYTVNAIHTFWSNKEKISGGVKITAVMEDLRQLKKSYPDYFIDEKEKDFKIEADEQEEAERCQWCLDPKIENDQIRIDELEKAKKEGTCARLHLKPEEITYLLDVKDKIFKK